jgi:hypothetical protein
MTASMPASRKTVRMSATLFRSWNEVMNLSFAALVCEKPRNQLEPTIIRGSEMPPTVVRGNASMCRV